MSETVLTFAAVAVALGAVIVALIIVAQPLIEQLARAFG